AKPYFAPLFRAGAVSGSVVIGEKTRLELRATYADEEEAKKAESDFRSSAEKASKALADPKKKAMEAIKGKGDPGKPRAARELPEAVGGVFALGTLNTIDEFLTNPPLTVEGNELVATVVLPALPEASMQAHAHSISLLFLVFQARPTPFGAGAPGPGAPGPGVPGPKELVPLVPDPKGPKEPKVEPKPDPKEASAREQSLQNLKQLALGMHTFHDKNNTFPAAAIVDEDGKPLLSWRVAILPYIGQEVLYKEFNLKEPWDSENNKKLIEKMPKVFADPRAPADAGKTYYKVFVGPPTGPTAAFDTRYKGRKLVEFLDGASNTVLIVEGGPAVEWTKPEDIRFAPDQKAPELSIGGAGDICLALADGSTRTVKWNKLPENVRKALITPDGAEVLPDDWDR
ncbi:MAG TPA: DUF1559 domain-containing protein, partial [Gemmataceae bacterium]|nr:DUF1559 domain-containing protein [Gemmataceae bacterium]